jgi:rhodanese-related sulfurtransferase
MDELITPDALREQLSGQDPPMVIDVRDADRWAAGHLVGAVHIPASEIEGFLDDIPKDKRIVTY